MDKELLVLHNGEGLGGAIGGTWQKPTAKSHLERDRVLLMEATNYLAFAATSFPTCMH